MKSINGNSIAMMKKWLTLIIILVLGLVLAACSAANGGEDTVVPTQPPPTITPSPTSLPPTALPTATPVPTGESLAGLVLWGREPVPGARLELRAPDWQTTGDESAVASATSGAAGQFLFVNPPTGEFALVGTWPDGQMSRGAAPAVTIEAGQAIRDFVIKLERGLTLTEPDLDQPVATLPTFAWENPDGLTNFRVKVVDSETAETVLDQEVTGSSLTVTDQLQPSREYSLVISALDAAGQETLANLTTGFTTQDTLSVPPPVALPSSCIQPGLATYVDRPAGYCFALPQKFGLGTGDGETFTVAGAPVDRSLEPLFATLLIEEVASDGRPLAAYVDEYLSQWADAEFEISRLPTQLGGETAELLEPVPGRLSSRRVLASAGPDKFLGLTFTPSFREMAPGTMVTPQRRAQIDADLLFETVMASFAYLPPPGETPAGATTIPDACLSAGYGIFVDPALGYCFGFPAGFSSQTAPDGGPMLVGPALDQSLSPVRALFTLMTEELADGQTLTDFIRDEAGTEPELGETEIGGLPAVLIEGIPANGSTRDIFVERGGIVYHFIFQPDVERAPEAEADLMALYAAITQSFTFIDPAEAPGGGD